MKVKDVIQTIIDHIPGAPLDHTLDVLVSGSMEWTVTGVVTTFTATMDVLREAVRIGANLIITHEDTFNNLEEAPWFQDNPVYLAKRKYIEDNHLAIFRFHDYWHMHRPDGIITGMLDVLGWLPFRDGDQEYIVNIPKATNREIATHVKSTLQLSNLRMVGDINAPAQRVALAVGSLPGDIQIQMFRHDVDTVICGETVEWQTCEYVRDANLQGQKISLIMLGHANSEEVGMRYLIGWLQPKLKDIPIYFVAAGDPIIFI